MTCRKKCLVSFFAAIVVTVGVAWAVLLVTQFPVIPFKLACLDSDGEFVYLEGKMSPKFEQALVDIHLAGSPHFAIVRHHGTPTIYHPVGLNWSPIGSFELYSNTAYYWYQDKEAGRQMGTSGWFRGPRLSCDTLREVAIMPAKGEAN